MNKHRYRISVEALDEQDQPLPERAFSFSARCHDELASIVARTRSRDDLTADDAAAMAVGLKLFGEIALEHRKEPLFAEISSQLGDFIRKLKSGTATQTA